MHARLMTCAAAGALLAAATLIGAGTAAAAPAADDAAIVDAERVVSTDNGVHAAPAGRVAAAPLAAVSRRRPAAAPAPIAPIAKPAIVVAVRKPAPAPVPIQQAAAAPAPAREPVRTVRTAARPVRRSATAHVVRASYQPIPARSAPAPLHHAHAQAAPAPVRLDDPRRLVLDAPDAVVGPPQLDDGDPQPALTLSAAAPMTVEPREAVAPPATIDSALASAAAADPAEPEGPSEEAAVYRRASAQASADAADSDAEAADTEAQAPADPPPAMTPVREDRTRPGPDETVLRQHVAFPRRSAEAAAAFDGYMHAVAAIDAGFKSGRGVAEALRTASAYDPRQLEEGMVAYGAMAALQSPRFVYGVMDAAADPSEREAMIDALLRDPGSATRLPGAGAAAALAGSAILREVSPFLAEGEALKRASYDVQHQDWSIAKAADQPGRLAAAKAASNARIAEAEADMARLVAQVSVPASARDARGGDGVSPVTAHSLALAALSILDGVGDDTRLEPVVSEATSAECLKLSKLNLFECLSVAGPEYEDVYCLAQHAVLDTGKCVAGAAASPMETAYAPNARMSRFPGLR